MTLGSHEHERGRDLINTGRGGIGNAVRSPSRGRPAETQEEKEAAADYQANHGPVHGGRGGFGNVRSPSRDPADRAKVAEEEKKEHAIQAEALRKDAEHPHHAGRGGAGNIRTDSKDREDRGRGGGGIGSALRNFSRSRSRDASRNSQRREHPHGDPNLGAVDESSSTINGSESTEKKSLVGKIASHLKG